MDFYLCCRFHLVLTVCHQQGCTSWSYLEIEVKPISFRMQVYEFCTPMDTSSLLLRCQQFSYQDNCNTHLSCLSKEKVGYGWLPGLSEKKSTNFDRGLVMDCMPETMGLSGGLFTSLCIFGGGSHTELESRGTWGAFRGRSKKRSQYHFQFNFQFRSPGYF